MINGGLKLKYGGGLEVKYHGGHEGIVSWVLGKKVSCGLGSEVSGEF